MSNRISAPKTNTLWLPLLVFGLLCTLVAFMGWHFSEQTRQQQHEEVHDCAVHLLEEITNDLDSRMIALRRLAIRWEYAGGIPEKEFRREAQSYFTDFPGFQAIEWVNKNFIVKWVVPLANNEQAVNLDLAFEENRRRALEKAKNSHTPTMTKPIELVQGGTGFLIYLPLFINNKFDGFILAVFNVTNWFDNIFDYYETTHVLDVSYHAIEIDNELVFAQPGWKASPHKEFSTEASAQILGHSFKVICRPTSNFFKKTDSILPYILTGGGIVFSFLIAFMVYLYQKAHSDAWQTYVATSALEREVQERKEAEHKLQQTSSRLALATRAGKIGVWQWELKTNRVTWDKRMYDLYDIPTDVCPTYETWRKHVHADDIDRIETLIQKAVDGKAAFDTELRIVTNEGDIRYVKAAAKVERNAVGAPLRLIGVNWDITQQKMYEKQIQHLAKHDQLTNLPSLRLATDRIELAILTAQRKKNFSAVLFMDLDGFKQVNDSLGHDAGDEVLRRTARRLEGVVREIDTVARIGGDEFLIILTDLTTPQDAAIVANKVLDSINEPYFYSGQRIDIGVSIGIAIYPSPNMVANAAHIIKEADKAMYSIKNSKKNGYAFAVPDDESGN